MKKIIQGTVWAITINLLASCYSPNILKEKVLYFNFMLLDNYTNENNGKVKFLGATKYNNIIKLKYKVNKFYYKVYHQGVPLRAEQYLVQNDILYKTYFFNKKAILYKTIENQNDINVTCLIDYELDESKDKIKHSVLTYKEGTTTKKIRQRYTYYKKIETCNNNTQIITLHEPQKRSKIKYYIKNEVLVKKEKFKGLYIYVYNGKGEYVSRRRIYSPELPIRIPKSDDYPFP